jgi:hypothetical protein
LVTPVGLHDEAFYAADSLASFVAPLSFENGSGADLRVRSAPGRVSLDTASFIPCDGIPCDGKTVLRTDSAFQSVEARDAMVASRMAEGINDCMNRLTELPDRQVV